MEALTGDETGMSAVMATLLLTTIVVVLSASSFVLLSTYRDAVTPVPPAIAVTSREGLLHLDSFDMRMISASSARPVEDFLFIMRTPQNGTLVATPPAGAIPDTLSFYFQLGASAGTGVHQDNGTTVGADGFGGFHVRVSDLDGGGRFGGGDTIDVWYDGDGDQAHQDGRDDDFPNGQYEFEIKHRPSESYVALETRVF